MKIRFFSLIVLLAVALAGCAPAVEVTVVNVTLSSYAIQGVSASLPAGKVRFVAQNTATDLIHELAVFKTDLPIDQLPTIADGSVDEEAEGLQLVGEIEDVEPGAVKTLTLDLAPGHYVVICNKDDHFIHKMYAEFTVAP